MVNCGVCSNSCDPNAAIKCAGKCNRLFHTECISAGYTRASKKDWFCENCKQSKEKLSSINSSKSETTSTPITTEFFVKTIEGFKHEIFKELKSNNDNNSKEFAELRSSLSYMNELLEKTREEMSHLKEENKKIRKENAELHKTVLDLDTRVRNMEQYSRQCNVEISGVPETTNEDMDCLLGDVAKAISIGVVKERILAAHRVPTYRGSRAAPIVVKFISRQERDRWIDGFKQVRPITADKINPGLAKEKVFINEHLAPGTKLLLKTAKEAAKKKDYSYVWCKEGKIYVRKENGTRCKRIDCVADLDKL